jgi:dUTP pyrophosphatase
MQVKFAKMTKKSDWPLPARATKGAAGYDLRACINHPITLGSGEYFNFCTGWSVAIPEGYEGQIRPRSGLAYKFGVTMINGIGTIDSDYRGEMKVTLINHGKVQFTIEPGDRIAQLVFAKVEDIEAKIVDALDETERGAAGFGSTGR